MKSSTKFNWEQKQSRCLANLHVLTVNGKEIGMIFKPGAEPGSRSPWRLYRGIGDQAEHLGWAWTKRDAMRFMEVLHAGSTQS